MAHEPASMTQTAPDDIATKPLMFVSNALKIFIAQPGKSASRRSVKTLAFLDATLILIAYLLKPSAKTQAALQDVQVLVDWLAEQEQSVTREQVDANL